MALVALTAPARADKTLMWLTDWYQGNLDSAVVTQVSIAHYGDTGAATNGFYFGKTDLVLGRTNAYALPPPSRSTRTTSTLVCPTRSWSDQMGLCTATTRLSTDTTGLSNDTTRLGSDTMGLGSGNRSV